MSSPASGSRLSVPLVTAGEMRALEQAAAQVGVSGETLMDEAGLGLAGVVDRIFRLQGRPGAAVIFAGSGHNAGDAFVLARHLAGRGWRVQMRLTCPRGSLKPLALRKLEQLEENAPGPALEWVSPDSPEVPSGRPLVLIDGLLGTGTTGSLRGPAAEAVRMLNTLRHREQAVTLAIDLPSGLGGGGGVVCADHTVTLGWPKEILFTDDAAGWTGRLHHVPLTGLPAPEEGDHRAGLVTLLWLRARLPDRPAFSRHKGRSGRVGILAGSRGLTGAARLAAAAASLMGGGLVTLFCPAEVYEILAASCPPEVMVRPVRSCQEVRDFPLDALGAGPGLGAAPLPDLAGLLLRDPRPVIVDADALNALAHLPAWREGRGPETFGGPRLLTPHPGELARLVKAWRPELADKSRTEQAQAMAAAFRVTVLAKSARSLTAHPDKPVLYNSTGHPLMARGGMGDVLTGFLTVFAAQGLNLRHAAALGSWLTGRGAERYHEVTGHEEPGVASEIMRHAAGAAMAELRAGGA